MLFVVTARRIVLVQHCGFAVTLSVSVFTGTAFSLLRRGASLVTVPLACCLVQSTPRVCLLLSLIFWSLIMVALQQLQASQVVWLYRLT